MHARMLKRRNTGGYMWPRLLLFRFSGLVPGRALRPVLDKAHGERCGRGDDGIGAVERGNGEISGGRCDGTDAESRTCAAGCVRELLVVLGVCSGRRGGAMACVFPIVVGSGTGYCPVMRHTGSGLLL